MVVGGGFYGTYTLAHSRADTHTHTHTHTLIR